jgi:hypothetical protein
MMDAAMEARADLAAFDALVAKQSDRPIDGFMNGVCPPPPG